MPAMSRQTLSGASRSAIVLAGSPSKSMIFQPARGAQRLAEVEVAVHPLDARARRRPARRSRPARRPRSASSAGAITRATANRSVITAAMSLRSRGPWGTHPRSAAWISASARPSRAASSANGCRRPARASASPQPSSAPVSFSTSIAKSAAYVRVAVPPGTLDPAVQPGHVADAGLVQRVVGLDVQIATELEPAEQLQHRRLAEHDRGVRLLAAERLRLVARRQALGVGRGEPHLAVGLADPAGVEQRGQQHPAGRRVLRGVVGDHLPEIGVRGPGQLGVRELRDRARGE